MTQAITLEQVAEKALQAETICRMMERYPDRFTDSEVTAMAALLSKLTGSVAWWLTEEQARQEVPNATN